METERATVKGLSERDRAYFRRIGEWKAQSHADARAWHLSLPIRQRLVRSLNTSIPARNQHIERVRAGLKRPDPPPEPGVETFYARARELKMIDG